jgi:cell division protein ftsI/penicillin-binding protein 2
MIKREVPYISYQDFLLKVLEMAEFLTYHRKKILVVFVISALLMTGLCGQLGFLMIARSDHYSKMADALHERERTIKASRGEIVDRNGTVIAANRTVCTVSVIHNQVKEPEKVIRELARILDLSEEEVRKKVEKWSSREIIRTNVEKSVGDEIMNLGLSGVKVDEDYRRYYPYGSLASKVLGFTGADNQGIIGLEVMYEKYLKGQDGLILTLSDAKGTELQNAAEERVEPIPGNTLTVSLDVNIQKYAEQAAYQVMEKKGAKAVSIIIMNPQNGEIYAMVNAPEFDLNDPFSLSGESSGLTGAELQDARNKMWRNRCINDTYEPGSTFKIITAAAGLEAGVVHLDDKFSCPGFRIVEDRKIRCHKVGGHGAETFLQGAMNSCNPVFIDVGQRLGVDSFYHYFEQFGLLGKTGIDLPGEAATIMHKKENMGLVELATVSFGQSFQITPIQLITTASSIINGGRRITPHFAVSAESTDGMFYRTFSYPERTGVVSGSTSETMRYILEQVVAEGSGKRAKLPEYRIGGKTATSEKLPRSLKKYISSFLGFAPADDPQVIALITIDEPVGIYYGGTIAAPVIADIFSNILPYLDVERVDPADLE